MQYIGNELELFENAINWKMYWSSKLYPYIKGDVLEVGAGLGGSTGILTKKNNFQSWTCLEPDLNLSKQIVEKVVNGILPRSIKVISGTIDTISNSNKFDLILYIDVLEHLENDQYELEKASDYLKKGGNLIVLAPAHNFLFSPFDTAVGHFRRYNKRMIKGWSFLSLDVSKVFYLDSVGMIASLMNKTLLKQSSPTLNQISFWDKTIIPISKVIDPLLLFLFGKTIISIYEKK